MSQGQNIFIQWLVFQFVDVPREILKAWRNYLLFNLKYFSIKLLIKTFFSYWRNYKWNYPRGFDAGEYLGALAGNFISRILGAAMRSVLIIIGLVLEVFIFFAGATVFLGWLVLPALLIIGLLFGLKII
jgi:hypothetical protein